MSSFKTIGYERANLENFIDALKAASVQIIIDVRDLPISRRKGFSKSALRDRLEEDGIQYVHLRGLGTPKPGRDAARSGNYERFEEIFISHLESEDAKNDFLVAIDQIKSHIACLLCYERNHRQCHRSIIADRLTAATGWTVEHLAVPENNSKPWMTYKARKGQSSSLRQRHSRANGIKRRSVAQA